MNINLHFTNVKLRLSVLKIAPNYSFVGNSEFEPKLVWLISQTTNIIVLCIPRGEDLTYYKHKGYEIFNQAIFPSATWQLCCLNLNLFP